MARVWYRRDDRTRGAAPSTPPPDRRARRDGPGRTPGYDLFDGSAGAGRTRISLAELGFSTDRLRQVVLRPDVAPEDLDALDLGRRFGFVILGSHFANTPDEALRGALLRAARRHLDAGADLLIEHHPVDWLTTAAPTSPTPGAEVGMEGVRVDPPFVHAVTTYDAGGREERAPFTARVLSDEELDSALAESGLRRRRRLGPTWLVAGPA